MYTPLVTFLIDSILSLYYLFYTQNNFDLLNKQSRRLIVHKEFIPHLIEGNVSLIPNATVYGSIIISSSIGSNVTSSTPSSSVSILELREHSAREMYHQLPFPVMEWPAVFTKACPRFRNGHKTERGLAFAHYQIWSDFVFFDHDILAQASAHEDGMFKSTTSTSTSNLFTYENRTFYKNGIPFLESDILVIFEDDADIAVVDIEETMRDELASMSTDMLYLGWCNGRLARPVPLCTHAYALTRKGCRKLIKYFEPCGLALDEQFVIMGKNNWITYRVAHPWNYKDRYNSRYSHSHSHDGTHGIFHQKKLGSLNGH